MERVECVCACVPDVILKVKKQEIIEPFSNFFSYDTRGSHAGTPSHWKDDEILENRAIFRTVRSPAELVIKPVKVRQPSEH